MILQIENDKIKPNLETLNLVENPKHGDIYFVTSEGCTYFYYNTGKNTANGEWVKDLDAVIYRKSSVLTDGFTNITTHYPNIIKAPLEEIKEAYKKYALDGCEYFDEVRAGLVLEYKAGVKTSGEIFDIETRLEPVTMKLKAGDWMTANYVLSGIAIEGAFKQDFKDILTAYITNYISNNY